MWVQCCTKHRYASLWDSMWLRIRRQHRSSFQRYTFSVASHFLFICMHIIDIFVLLYKRLIFFIHSRWIVLWMLALLLLLVVVMVNVFICEHDYRFLYIFNAIPLNCIYFDLVFCPYRNVIFVSLNIDIACNFLRMISLHYIALLLW